MIVFVDVVLLENFLIDSVLLLLVLKTLNKNTKKSGIFVSALFGAVFAVLSVGVAVNGIFAVIIKIVVAFLMTAALEWNFEKILLKTLLLLLYTFCFGGMVLCLCSFFGMPVQNNGFVTTYSNEIPVGAICALLVLFACLFFKMLKLFYKKRQIQKFCYNIAFEINGKTLELKGFLDTGNSITKNGKPVVLLEEQQLKMCFNKPFDYNLFLTTCENLNVNGISGTQQICVFKPTCCVFGGKKQDVFVGVVGKNFCFGEFDVILNPKMMEV